MITINLLPEEYRRKARTPIKLMLVVVVAVTINSGLAAYWGWLAFGVAANAKTQRTQLETDMAGLEPQVKYHEALKSETQIHASRESTLAQITKDRILWTRKLDELIDVVNLGGDGVRHYIWFDDLSVNQLPSTGNRNQGFGELKSSGHSGSGQWNQVANFLEDIEDANVTAFSDIFGRPASPAGTQLPPDKDLIPSEVWSFPFSLKLLDPDARQAAREEREALTHEEEAR